MKQKKCIIIGAGIGGLATAVRMAARNYSVIVLEKNNRPGGKIHQIQRDGFRFDTGPSLFTLPNLVTELLDLGSDSSGSKFRFKKLKNVCRYFYDDGTTINVPENPTDFAKEIEKKTGEPAENILNYLKTASDRYLSSADLFIFNSLKNIISSARKKQPGELMPLLKVKPLRTMHNENQRIFRSPQVIQIFDRYATYNGSSPYKASSMLNMIAHLEHNEGAFFPEKGMYSIVEAVYQKALSLGVEFKFEKKVTGLTSKDGRITKVIADEEEFNADLVISDMDVNTFYRDSGRRLKMPRSVRKPSLSSSALIFYWGMRRSFPQLDVHNILFSSDYAGEFRSIFKEHQLFDDPTVYIFISSKIVESDAPKGQENWFVMINAPSTDQAGMQDSVDKARRKIIEKIQRTLKFDPQPDILFEEVATPQTIETNTGSWKGALYGNNSNSIWSAFLRHQNKSKEFGNLFFTGGSVHPGGGIPLCLASAAIVEKEIEQL
ncbi:1-hydroxycarotenoid 3,4-desaturase CrtD [Marinilabilia sp.]|uniref:1-hydroxycarotenoid 3,4-desaturase CrtD n=1 Tax=Marinilabilia sp. TaxID=2021252 RepID=UPI0025BCD95D|nr:1-hydroxycarotenoid 3,4-desaturase CrtD [Marinilabilia sp.]